MAARAAWVAPAAVAALMPQGQAPAAMGITVAREEMAVTEGLAAAAAGAPAAMPARP